MHRLLLRVFNRLLEDFGEQHWWPTISKNKRLEIIIGAILTQNTSWKQVEKAIRKLHERGLLNEKKLREIPEDELANLIRCTGYYKQKARKIKEFLKFKEQITREKKKEIDILRRDLTKVDDEKRKADINRKIKELRVEINKLNAELRTLQKEEISRIEKIMDNISGFFGKLGLNFKLFNKGPYEHRFDKRVTKFYLIATGRNYFGPVTSFIRKKMLS